VIASLFGLVLTLGAFLTRSYRVLSTRYTEPDATEESLERRQNPVR